MIEVKSLLVKFGTDTKAMEAGFQKADGLIAANAEKFKKAGRAMAMAGAAVVGSIGLMVKGYVKAGDEIGKMSKRTGISTVTLSEFKHAAELSGSSLGTVEKAVIKMGNTIGEAKLGLKTYTDAFALIGMEVSELEGLNPEEQFLKMAEGVAAIVDPSDRAHAALKLFGKSGTKLIPMFDAGVEGMAAMRAEAHTLGQVWEDTGPAEALTDAMDNLKKAGSGVSMAMAEVLVPAIQSITETITNAVVKFKDWIKENPVLSGVLIKVAGAVGILFAVLGPLLMLLPALSAGFTMLWGAITGPIGIVIGAIALVAGAAYLIYKNWEPIKEFFIGLWKDVSGFFVNAFNNIKAQLLDWAIKIADVLAKIPIAKKLAEPWRDSLMSMRADMDATAANVNTAAENITAATTSIGQAWLGAITGTEQFKNVIAAAGEKTGLFNQILAGAGAFMTEYGGKHSETAEVIAAANEKILSLTKTMVDEIKKATMDEYAYSKWALDQKLLDREAAINAEAAAEGAGAEAIKALEEQKNAAIATARAAFRAEDASLDKAHKDAALEREIATAERKKELLAGLRAEEKAWREADEAEKKEKEEAYLALKADVTDQLKQIELDKFDYLRDLINQEYEAKKDQIEKTIEETGKGHETLKELEVVHKADLRELDEQEAEEKRQRFEDTMAHISGILNTIGSLFSQAHQNKMTEIDQEETRRIDAINAQYDAQIAALQGIVAAEEAKTQEVLDTINREYDDKRQHILDNMEDNEDRDAALAELEQTREDRLAQALIDREIAEQSAADALVAMEDEKDKALDKLSEDLEIERAKERKKAAKQEKAVALLSAIVNTAAAISKALPNIPLAIAVGILGAIQIGIIAAQPLPLKEGGIVMSRTEAVIGEAGPEAVIPLNKLGGGLMQPAPVYVKMSLYNYGDINNVGDLDEISDRFGRRLQRQLERGRRS